VKVGVGLLIALVTPFPTVLAQTTTEAKGGGFTVGWARVADTSALQLGLRIWSGPFGTGAHFDGAAGFDFIFGRHSALYDVLDADLGYAMGFNADATTCLILRGGGSMWMLKDSAGGFGANLGVELRHLSKSGPQWIVDLNWRRFSGLTLPSVTVGLVGYN